MGTTTDKLNRLINTKEGIRQEINRAYGSEKISTSSTFKSYIQKLEEHPYYVGGIIDGTIESIKVTDVTSIGEYAFYKCSNLKNISFPNVISISQAAFEHCWGIKNVSFPNATSIDNFTFSGCSGLTSVSLPKANSIGRYAFNDCVYLGNVSFPSVTIVDGYVFDGCSGLSSATFANATRVNGYAFNGCSGLNNVSFPKATLLANRSFSDTGLVTASFPKLQTIENGSGNPFFGYGGAFSNCTRLTTLYIGTESSTVCTLGTYAFEKCNALANIYVPASLVNSYKNATNWSSYSSRIKAAP